MTVNSFFPDVPDDPDVPDEPDVLPKPTSVSNAIVPPPLLNC